MNLEPIKLPSRYNTVSFLSDFGTRDEFVGVVHSVLHNIAPHVDVIDITHGIPAHDVRAGSLALARSVEYLCPGIVLAVVDPGVGTERKRIAVEVGEGESVLIGPDNGLLAPAVAMVGGPKRVVELTNLDFQLNGPSTTFDGRDVFAPAAAHLVNGVDIAELGEVIDPNGLVPALIPVSYLEGEALHAEILWIDQYGNIQLNIGPEDLPPDELQIKIDDQMYSVDRVTAFEQISEGGLGFIVNSTGLVEIAACRSSAANELRACIGDSIQIVKASRDSGISTPVALQSKKENS